MKNISIYNHRSRFDHSCKYKDLIIAKNEIASRDLNLIIVKDGKTIFEGTSPSVVDLLNAFQVYGRWLEGSVLADRVVGRAVALICRHIKIAGIYGIIMSNKVEEILMKSEIFYCFEEMVPFILDRSKSFICPLERAVADTDNPIKAYNIIKNLLGKPKN